MTHCRLETTLSPSQHGWWAENLHLELFAAADPCPDPEADPCSFEASRACASSGCWLPRAWTVEPVCHVEGQGRARPLVCTPHTRTHTLPTAQMHTHAHNRAHACTTRAHTRAHMQGDGRRPTGFTVSREGGGGKWGQAGLAPEPITSLGRESGSASWRRWPELSLQRPVEP